MPTNRPLARHVMVDQGDGEHPGLLVEWARRTEHGDWEGRVIHWAAHRGEWVLREDWFPAGMLREVRDS